MKKNKLLIILILLFAVFNISGVFAQQRKITGTVLGDNLPLPGASISVKNEKLGAVTNMDGKYEISVSKGTTLIFSYLGFKNQEIVVGEKNVINVSLMSSQSQLEDVVVIGYGTSKRKDLTGSISTVSAADIDRVKPVTFEGALQNRVAGVQVVSSEGGPDAAFKIKIRGGTSINAGNDPLYVIDGFPISGGGVGTSTGLGNSSTSPLATLDPSSIESIDILKDASATAIYGSRGANGVVIITTKQGKSGTSNLAFETFTTISTLSNKLDVLSAQEFIDYRNSFQPWTPTLIEQKKYLAESYRVNDGTGIYVPVTLDYKNPITGKGLIIDDWQDEITRTAITKNYTLTANGGDEKTKYSVNMSYLNSEGIIETSGLERYSLNVNINQKINNKLSSGFTVNAGYVLRSGVVTASNNSGQGRSGIVTNAIYYAPIEPVRHLDNLAEEARLGIVYDENGRMISNQNGDLANPMAILEKNTNEGRNFQGRFNAFLEYKFSDRLKFRSSVRGNASFTKNKAYFSEEIGWSRFVGGSATTNVANNTSLVIEQNLTYNKKIGKHNINAVLVAERQENEQEWLETVSQGFGIPDVNLDALQGALVTLPTFSDASTNSLQSYLARVQYDFSNKYLLTASARYDGSSRFADENKWGFFPSLGVAWRISNEKFLKDNSTISNLKLRLSYGVTGNTEIAPYQSLSRAGINSYIFGGNVLNTGASIVRIENPDLTWETTTQSDVGLSIGLLKNRINIEADYYNKDTKDLLLQVPIPVTSGYRTAFQNLGLINNRGFEFSLNAIVLDKKDLKWKCNFNISFNKNEVKDLGGAKEFFVTAIGDQQIQSDYVIRVGESLGAIYGFEYAGVYNYNDFTQFDGKTDAEAAAYVYGNVAVNENWYGAQLNSYTLKDGIVRNSLVAETGYRPGMSKFVDQNGDGVINDNDRKIIGDTQPLHFGSFTNEFSYGGFDLSIQTGWSYGNDIYNKNIKKGIDTASPWANKLSKVNERWDPEHPTNTLTSFNSGISGNINSAANSLYIEDGSYFRLSNITLSYRFKQKMLNSTVVKGLKLFAAVDNVHVWTNYSGWDPDVSVGNNQLTPGLDIDSYPRSRSVRIGLNLNF